MKLLITILLFFPLFTIAQRINTTETKSISNIYNDAIKQFIVHNYTGKLNNDTLFVEKRENFSDSILTKINGVVIKIIDWPEINSKIDLNESFTLNRFFSLKFNNGLFSISVVPFHATKNSDGIKLGNGGGCEMIYTYDSDSKQFHFKKTKCWGI